MPTPIIPVDAYPASFTIAADGEAVSQAIRADVMQEYADAITYVRNRTVPLIQTWEISGGGLIHQSTPATYVGRADGGWQDVTGAGDFAIWKIPMPVVPAGAIWKITNVDVWTINVTGHGAPVPASTQSCEILRTNAAAGQFGATIVGPFSDPSAGAALDVDHRFSSGAISVNLNPAEQWYLKYTGESGLNSAPDTVVRQVVAQLEPV